MERSRTRLAASNLPELESVGEQHSADGFIAYTAILVRIANEA